jgi:hypothetical protein
VAWIDLELGWYVKDYISDSDYGFLRKNLIDIAEAHAMNVRRLRKQAVAKDGRGRRRPQQPVVRRAGKKKTTTPAALASLPQEEP